MRKRKKRTSSVSDFLPLILFVLFICIAIGVWFLLRESGKNKPDIARTLPSQTNPPVPPLPPSTSPGITENRLVFGVLPVSTSPESAYITLRNIGYVSGYSEKRRNPLWVSYRVFRNPNPTILPRPKGDFLTDLRTRTQVTHQDFTGSGYDRGHMAPNSAIATRYGVDAQRETFLMSNISPQAPSLNQKVWERLERSEIDYADRYEEVWIIDGPIFPDLNGGTEKKLRSGVYVPSAFYKILVDEQHGKPRVFAVIMPQTVKGTESPDQFRTSIRDIETQTRLDFLSELDPKIQKELEEKVWPMW